ncbi:MAG: coproporphyrinogen III oxidase [Actinotignum schaalii]|nr:coproporphyrinogen III oxidase [Actinotignum schaalii]
MASLPHGEPAPASGALPNPDVSAGFSAYVHIPFCTVRCGYCDFNTYTKASFGPGAGRDDFPASLAREIALSREVLDTGTNRAALRTVFFGGGTPTLLDAGQLVAVLAELERAFGLAEGAEITTECNPESVDRAALATLRAGGFTRISFGMQSAVPEVLRTLDRQHSPGQVERVTGWARELDLEYSLDLIYGAPGETMEQWRTSLAAALALEPAHISAYGLMVEPGTKMGMQARRGLISLPDPDELADKYEVADDILSAAGYRWYEISNWARPGDECRHNCYYWENANWWGYGPGAHSHINGVRFWNVKHPRAYADRVWARGIGNDDGAAALRAPGGAAASQPAIVSPALEREILSPAEQREEKIMLGIRMSRGIDIPRGVDAAVVEGLVRDGLVEAESARAGRLVLTRRGRLLADTVTRALW